MFERGIEPRFLILFLLSIATSLSVALINGYPLLFPDSYGYIGFGPEIGAISTRSVALDFLARITYPLLSVWSVIVIQAIAFAYVVACFAAQYAPREKPVEVVLLIAVSQFPLYASMAMADAWLVIMVLALLTLIARFRWPLMLVLAVAIAAHGGNLYLFVLASIIGLVLLPDRLRLLRLSVGAIGMAVLFGAAVNIMMDHDSSNESSWSLVSSKILIQAPEVIELKCARDPGFAMCSHLPNIQEAPLSWCTDYLPDCFLWRKQSFFREIETRELNAAGRELFLFALVHRPWTIVEGAMSDLKAMLSPGCSGDFDPLPRAGPELDAAPAGAPMHPNGLMVANPDYERSLQSAGLWRKPRICAARVWLKLVTYAGAVAGICTLLVLREKNALRISVFLILVVFANASFFAALSGPYERYHERAIFLLLVPLLLAAEKMRQRLGMGVGDTH